MRIGAPRRRKPPKPSDLEKARVNAARRIPAWVELDPDDLVQRGTRQVSVSTDQVYAPARGVQFNPHSVNALADHAPLRFTVIDGHLAFYELEIDSWSAQVARRVTG